MDEISIPLGSQQFATAGIQPNRYYQKSQSIPGTSVGGFTSGSVIFADTNGNLNQDNANFFYNATNKSLSLGTTSSIGKFATIGAISGVTTNGTINIGAAATAFDGVTAGFFAGVAGGTYLAMNAPSGATFNYVDFQTAGLTKFAVRANDGTVTIPTGGEFRPGVAAYTATGVRAGGDLAFGYAGSTNYSAEIDVRTIGNGGTILFRTGVLSSQQPVVGTWDANGNLGIGLTPAATNRLDVLDTTLAGSGSLNGSVVNIAQTWNTTGAPTAFKVNVTNTASNTGLTLSKLFDFQVGGVSKFFFDVNAGAFYYATGLIRNTNNQDLFNDNNSGLLSIYSTGAAVSNTVASGTRAVVKIGDVETWAVNTTNTAVWSGLQVSPIANLGASNSGGTFYGARINPIFTSITGLTAAYIFAASAGSVDKFQVTSAGLVNCLIDGNSLQVGSGSNVAVYAGFAAQRGFFGYDGTSMTLQGGTAKAVGIAVNSNTFGSGTVKLLVGSGATLVGIGGTITNSATGAGAVMIVNDTGTDFISTITKYNNVATAGYGVPAIYGSGRSTAQTAAVASVAAYTVGAADGSFEISANVLVTASTLHNFTVTCTYTDEGNTSRTLTLPFQLLAGTSIASITNAQGAVPYEGSPVVIRAKAATSITIATTGTFTTVTYNVEAHIIQIK